jgi:hypothetical protein
LEAVEQLARDGAVLLRDFAGEDGDLARLFGKEVQEVSGPVDFVAGSHAWPDAERMGTSPAQLYADHRVLSFSLEPGEVDVWRNFADIGELHETMQIISWNLEPGDVAVSHGHTLRLRHRPHYAVYEDGERVGGDLDGLHAAVTNP